MRNARSTLWSGVVLALTALGAFGCRPAAGPQSAMGSACGMARLEDGAWRPQVRARLEAFIDARGCASPAYDPAKPPVATFDWDNTMIKNDIGEGTLFWMMRHDKLKALPWPQTSDYLTGEAQRVLAEVCVATPAGTWRTSGADGEACAEEILSIYDGEVTRAGHPGFTASPNARRMKPSYAWAAGLLAGYTPDELRAIARQVIDEAFAAPVDGTVRVGARDVPAGIRIYQEMRGLVTALRNAGFDIWVVSASAEPLVQTIAAEVGIKPDRVIGVRAVAGPTWTKDLQPCGADQPANASLTFMDGKRCWINQVVYPTRAADPWQRLPGAQAFAAGDANTDVTMLLDAEFRLVIDRQKDELLCQALHGGEAWLRQPMFIAPLVTRTQPYVCETACLQIDGSRGPCVDGSGTAIGTLEAPPLR